MRSARHRWRRQLFDHSGQIVGTRGHAAAISLALQKLSPKCTSSLRIMLKIRKLLQPKQGFDAGRCEKKILLVDCLLNLCTRCDASPYRSSFATTFIFSQAQSSYLDRNSLHFPILVLKHVIFGHSSNWKTVKKVNKKMDQCKFKLVSEVSIFYPKILSMGHD